METNGHTNASATATKSKAASATKRAKPQAKKATSRKPKASKRNSRNYPAPDQVYSESADRLFDRGRKAISEAYTWLGQTSAAVPDMARKMRMPAISKQVSMRGVIEDKPLLLGALGLGLGAIVGGLLIATGAPSIVARHSASKRGSSNATNTARKSRKKSR